MNPRVPINGKPSNIGPQFDNVGTYVLSPGTEIPVPRGALGELCAAGKLVGRGYLNRPDLTNEKFPLLKQYNEKIYRTGDLVRILHDGSFDFAGRADDQIKLRGQRLEIGEINNVVKKADVLVRAVSTLVLKHPKQQKDQIVSFVVFGLEQSREQSKPVVQTGADYARMILNIVATCKSQLPAYMVPTHFLPLSHLPLSINNKVDNKILRDLYQHTSVHELQTLTQRNENLGEWNDTEKMIRLILAEVTKLHPSEINRSSTVLELGLDSISIVGLSRRMRKSGLAAAKPSLIMQNPMLSRLAIALSVESEQGMAKDLSLLDATQKHIVAFTRKYSDSIAQDLALSSSDIERIFPCTPLQEGIIARTLDSDKPLYFNHFPMVLGQTIDIPILRAAWMTVVQFTDILRTCFSDTPDGYAQVILKQTSLDWEEIEIYNEEIQSVLDRGIAIRTLQAQRLKKPPVSILCIRTPSRHVLVMNIFHALYDGNSMPFILSDVKSAYFGIFKPRPCQFTDVIPYLLNTDLDAAQRFWTDVLKPASALSLDRICQLSENPDHPNEDFFIDLVLDISPDDFKHFCNTLQCTAQAVFQAAWASVLARYSGPVVALGIVVSGRSLPIDGIEGVIGPTFNTLPCSVNVGEALSWERLVKSLHIFNSVSLPFHHTPLRLINKWLRNQAHFNTLFVFQKEVGQNEGFEGLWEFIQTSAMVDVSIIYSPFFFFTFRDLLTEIFMISTRWLLKFFRRALGYLSQHWFQRRIFLGT
jgi:aryl carrier-like protein